MAHSIRPHVTMPTTSSTIQELTQSPDTISVWLVTGVVSSSVKPGR
jgi:hypothetical protein